MYLKNINYINGRFIGMKPKITLDPSWHSRRLVVRLTLLSCLLLSSYAVWNGPVLAQAVLPWTAGLAGAVIGSYVFGSSWERVSGVPSLNSYQYENNIIQQPRIEPFE
jgi:hypothetical protein